LGIRDLILTVFGWGCVPLALTNAYYGLLGYVWLSVMKPQSLVWSASVIEARMAFFVMIALLLKHFATEGPKFRVAGPMIGILALWAWFAVCTLTSSYFDASLDTLIKFSKVILGPLIVTAIIDTPARFKVFLALLAACPGLYGLKLGLFGLMGGTTHHGGPIGLDNNDTALFIAMGIPLLFYVALTFKEKWLRCIYLLAFFLSGPAVIATTSRGGMLSMAAAYTAIFWIRYRTIKTVLLVVMLGFSLYAVVPEDTMNRYYTITEYEEDASAMGRIAAWKTAWNMAIDNPVWGGGLGLEAFMRNYPYYQEYEIDRPRATHSVWFQILGECGFVGLGIFLLTIFSTLKMGFLLRNRAKPDLSGHRLEKFAEPLLVTVVVYLVGGTFLSQVRFEFFYYIITALCALFLICKRNEMFTGAASD